MNIYIYIYIYIYTYISSRIYIYICFRVGRRTFWRHPAGFRSPQGNSRRHPGVSLGGGNWEPHRGLWEACEASRIHHVVSHPVVGADVRLYTFRKGAQLVLCLYYIFLQASSGRSDKSLLGHQHEVRDGCSASNFCDGERSRIDCRPCQRTYAKSLRGGRRRRVPARRWLRLQSTGS